MALPKKIPVKQMLKLVDQFSSKELKQFQYEMRLKELREEIMIGIKEADSGQLVPAEEVLQELKERARLRKTKK